MPDQNPRVTPHLTASVVIPNYRGWPVLEKCLQSLEGQTCDSYEVIVVDDASGDGTPARLSAAYPWVIVVDLPENRGFCGAVNRGLETARGQIVAILNNDTIADPAWLASLLKAFEADPEVGFCASRMLRTADPGLFDGAGDEYSRFGLGYRVGKGLRDKGQFEARDVLWASGGACAYRRRTLDAIGLLDERFIAYYEDVDMGLRAWSAGWRGRYVPDSVVYHHGHWTETSTPGVFLTTRNSVLVLAKHWPARLLLTNLPWLLYGQVRTGAWAMRHGHTHSWISGLAAALCHFRDFRVAPPLHAAWHQRMSHRYPFGDRPALPA